MTLEELKKAMDAALAALTAKPEDTALKTAAEDATTAYNAAVAAAEDDGDGFDESKADEATKKYIAKLRSENAKHRTKNKDLVSSKKSSDEKLKAVLKAAGITEEEDPAEKLKAATATSEQLAFKNAVLGIAVEHGIPKAGLDYFEYLVSKAASELAEGEELADEALAEIVAKVKATSDGKGSSTSVGTGGKGGGTAPKPGASGQISLDQFCSMSITEKSKLYNDRPEIYTALHTEAKQKKRLV